MKIKLTEKDKTQLKKIIYKRTLIPNNQKEYAKIILKLSEGKSVLKISKEMDISRPTIYLWIKRYIKNGIEGITKELKRSGRPKIITESIEKEIVNATLQTKPLNATHWSTRTLATKKKVSKMTILRIWKKYNLKPHLIKTFKISNDPQFIEKVKDIVGLYLNPPEKALVISVDEKTQIQALDRTQLSLPLKIGHKETKTHDYKRYGTTTLFAALNMLDGTVIGSCEKRHTHKEFLKFLKKIDRQIDNNLDLHLIVDNYSSHKTKEIKSWLEKHPRFYFHFTPTSASWINMVERFFSELSTKKIKRSFHKSVKSLIDDIYNFIKNHNQNPKIYKWKQDAKTILNKIRKCKETLEAGH